MLITKPTNSTFLASFSHPFPRQETLKSNTSMGGNQQKKKSFSFFGMFKSKPKREYDYKDDYMKAYKIWPSDEDRGRWVAEPGIDNKASAFINSRTEKYWKSVEVGN